MNGQGIRSRYHGSPARLQRRGLDGLTAFERSMLHSTGFADDAYRAKMFEHLKAAHCGYGNEDYLGRLYDTWIARNDAKPDRRDVPAWVLQTTVAWSEANLETPPEAAAKALLQAFEEAAGVKLPAPSHTTRLAQSHRRLARGPAPDNAPEPPVLEPPKNLLPPPLSLP